MAKKPKPTIAAVATTTPTEPTGAVTPFDQLPDGAFLRCAELVRSPKNPSAPVPCSKGTLWRWIRAGQFPKPVKLSDRLSGWKVGAVRSWLAAKQAGG